MFDVLSRGFKNARLKLQGKTELTEANIADSLREVRSSLIQADVQIGVIKEFMAAVKVRALGDIVPLRAPTGEMMDVSPDDWFIKACYDELVELMGPVNNGLSLNRRPSIILMVGLQGSGKTTTSGKLAKKLIAEGKKPLLVAADIYRPAAVEQLMVLGRRLNVPVFSIKGMDPVQLSKMGVAQAKNTGRDVVIIDTAGRLAVDETLMTELDNIKREVNPDNILFVVDAMIGQDSVATAKAFDERMDFDGFILTKLDGDARGGAALSIKHVTGKPIKYLGQGEELDRLEEFRPEGLAQRILGFGDVVGLMQDFERHVDKDQAEADAAKMLKGEFGYNDFVKQLNTIRKMGPLKDIFSKLPGLSGMMDQIPEEAFDDREMDRTLAIIKSMTNHERREPAILTGNGKRFKRIAKGCGREYKEVSELHERFLQAQQMMKGLGGMMGGGGGGLGGMMGGGGMGGLGDMMSKLTGGAGGAAPPPPRAAISADDKKAKRAKQKAAKKARKKNRK
jgi:signal recognition particle subunit SRP54